MPILPTVSGTARSSLSLLTILGIAGLGSAADAQTLRVASATAVRSAVERLTPAAMRAHIADLAADSLRGRSTPSPELERAATHVAANFARSGLTPAGDGGDFIQRYPIRCTRPDSSSYVALSLTSGTTRWQLGRDVAAFAGRMRDGDATGPAVLVAGIAADTADAFGGVDLRDATVVAVIPAKDLQRRAQLLPHFTRALRRGAATWLIVTDVPAETFAGMAAGGTQPTCGVAGEPEGAALTLLGVRDSTAAGLLQAAGEDVTVLLDASRVVVRPLPEVTVRLHGASRVIRETSAPNVIGILPGSDPTVSAEHVVVTAHLDHLGVGRAVDGDSIYNGADDNASGVAAVLEIAQAFTRLDVRPRRSLVFAAVSGEENGLWGSRWYVDHPTVPLSETVAALNLDMISRGWLDSVSVIGLDLSTLGESVRRVARENSALVPQPVADHWPEKNFLERSDHIGFARRGVPILYFLDGTPSEYHRVTDSVDRVDAEAAARIARLAFLTALDVANASARPQWDADSRGRIVTDDPSPGAHVGQPSPGSTRIPTDSLYLGQTPPDSTPRVFRMAVTPGHFSAERIAIADDGGTIYYQELDGYTALDGKPHSARSKLYRYSDGRWQGPETLFEDLIAPAFSLSEDTLFVQTVAGQAYYAVRTDTGWGTPAEWSRTLPFTHYLQVTTNGHYYASSVPSNSLGGVDRSRVRITRADTTATSLGLPLNTAGPDLDFFVARDESFMIVARYGTLAISYPRYDGGWTFPKSLGRTINFGLGAWGPYVTRDHRYLFYTTGTKPDYSDTYVYWVSIAGVIERLRTTNFEPYLRTPIPPQSLTLHRPFRFAIPDVTFTDDDGDGTLTQAASLGDGAALPSWLTFDPATRTLTGTPTDPGSVTVRVTATDPAGASVSTTFELRSASDGAPTRQSTRCRPGRCIRMKPVT